MVPNDKEIGEAPDRRELFEYVPDASLGAISVASVPKLFTDVHLAAGADFNGGELFTMATMAERCWAC